MLRVEYLCGKPFYTIQSANDYFAFGKTLRSFNGGSTFGHQGSERENELSENDYYTHFRGLDDDIARWKQVDPKINASMSPYVSMDDNPVIMTDVLGDCPTCPPFVRANGGGYAAIGFFGGVANSVVSAAEGMYNAVRHPINTLETAMKISSNDPVYRAQMGAAVVKLSSEIKNTIKNGDDTDKGYLVGQTAGNIALLFVGGEVGTGTKALAGAGKEMQTLNMTAKLINTARYTFNITAKEGDLLFYSTKVGESTLEFGGNFSKADNVLTIKNFDIDGTMTNKLGVSGIRDIMNEFGKQQGVEKIIIEGAKRTTGAKPGKVPAPIEFKITQ